MASQSLLNSLVEYFEDLDDPRIDWQKLHELPEILLIMFCGVICGAESWRDVVDFGESKLDYLKRFSEFKMACPQRPHSAELLQV